MRNTPGGNIHFQCNICGTANCVEAAAFHRELAHCESCGSSPRFRGIAAALSDGLYGRRMPLMQFPADPSIRDVGFSDWPGYAKPLAEKFDYVCTWYEGEPRIDLTSRATIGPYRASDFVICSDVLEHVPKSGLQKAFRNLHRLLRRGGLLVFSVPDTDAEATEEHFGWTWTTRIVTEADGQKALYTLDPMGRKRIYRNLIFHGGGDMALEMRLFFQSAVLRHLEDAGFSRIKVYDEALPDIGYFWSPIPIGRPDNPHHYLGYVMTARA